MKRILTHKLLLIIILCCSLLISPMGTAAREGDSADDVITEIRQIYKKARNCLGSSFSGLCGTYVNYQLMLLGINTGYVCGDGNDEFDNYCKKTVSSGGYNITAYYASKNNYSLKTILNKITDNGKKDAYNILVGFTRGSGSAAGQKWGHTFFINAIIDGVVYYSESYNDSDYNSEGVPTALTISQLAARYPDDGTTYHLDGVIHFHKISDVSRSCGSTRYETAESNMLEYMEAAGLTRVPALIIANGENFPDALSASCLSIAKGAPILLAGATSNSSGSYPGEDIIMNAIDNYLTPGGKVYILGGEAAVAGELEDAIETKLGYAPIRLEGPDRYGTNSAVLSAYGDTGGKSLIICSGNGFADALSASCLGLPIMLVNGKASALTQDQRDYISGGGFSKVYIFGGEAAVSKSLASDIAGSFGAAPIRISGSDRYATSISAAETFYSKTTEVVLASGDNFPDGLTGGLLACELGRPMVLVSSGNTAKKSVSSYIDKHSIVSYTLIGGSSAISYDTLEAITQ